MTALHGGRRTDLDLTQPLGHELGIDHFILSGQPHVEEAYWLAEEAGAVLRSRGLV